MNKSKINVLKPKAKKFVELSNIPVNVADVAKNLGVSWSTARQILMELVLEGKICSQKTTKAWIFSKTRKEEEQ